MLKYHSRYPNCAWLNLHIKIERLFVRSHPHLINKPLISLNYCACIFCLFLLHCLSPLSKDYEKSWRKIRQSLPYCFNYFFILAEEDAGEEGSEKLVENEAESEDGAPKEVVNS